MFLYFKLAWRNIWRNKRRTILTLSMISLAVLCAGLMRAMQEGAYEQMVKNAAGMYTGYAQIQAEKYWDERSLNNSFELTEELISNTQNIKSVEAAVPRIESFALGSAGTLTKGAVVLGIDPVKENQMTKLSTKLSSGDYLKETDDAVLISDELAEHLNIGAGDTLVLISQGFRGVNAAGKYPVKGVLDITSSALSSGVVYMSIPNAQYLFGMPDRVTSLSLMINKQENLNQVVTDARKNLSDKPLRVMDWPEMLPGLVQQIDLDRQGGKIFVYILYMIIAFGIFGTILMMTVERRKEFGVLMGIGMNRWRMMLTTWLESIFLGLSGILIGVLITYPLIYYFHVNPITFTGEAAELYEKFGMEPIIPTSTNISVLLSQATLILAMCSLLSMYPIYVLRKLRPVDAMRG